MLSTIWRWLKPKSIDEQVLWEMSFPRDVFIDKIQEIMGGALCRFYTAEYAKANGLTELADTSMHEIEQRLSYLAVHVYMHPIRFRNRRKALTKALSEMQQVDKYHRNFAMNRVIREYQVKPSFPIPPDAAQRFYELLESYIQDAESKHAE